MSSPLHKSTPSQEATESPMFKAQRQGSKKNINSISPLQMETSKGYVMKIDLFYVLDVRVGVVVVVIESERCRCSYFLLLCYRRLVAVVVFEGE